MAAFDLRCFYFDEQIDLNLSFWDKSYKTLQQKLVKSTRFLIKKDEQLRKNWNIVINQKYLAVTQMFAKNWPVQPSQSRGYTTKTESKEIAHMISWSNTGHLYIVEKWCMF